jgi:hypothetical protein
MPSLVKNQFFVRRKNLIRPNEAVKRQRAIVKIALLYFYGLPAHCGLARYLA